MRQAADGLTWGVERRLEFIEFRLFWDGGVNRADIIDMFGVSVPQASKDLTLYQERAPRNAVYDKSAKRYVASESFEPCFLKPDPSGYLSQLRSVAEGILESSGAWIGNFPPFDTAPTPVRGVNVTTLRLIVSAIRRGDMIEIKYQSLSRPEPRWRWLAPHALGFDGFRWHARAYCETDQTFKDFLLSRILETRGTRKSVIRPGADRDWHQHVVLEVGPHPDLSEMQKKVIALDYEMRGGKARIRVRRAFLYYALKRLGLDSDAKARRPQDQQIVLLNRDVLASEPVSPRTEG
jgi:hypothetical protein